MELCHGNCSTIATEDAAGFLHCDTGCHSAVTNVEMTTALVLMVVDYITLPVSAKRGLQPYTGPSRKGFCTRNAGGAVPHAIIGRERGQWEEEEGGEWSGSGEWVRLVHN